MVPVALLLPAGQAPVWLRLCDTLLRADGGTASSRELGRVSVSAVIEASGAGTGPGAETGVGTAAGAGTGTGASTGTPTQAGPSVPSASGRLEVQVIQCRNLPAVESSQDPFVALYSQSLGSDAGGSPVDGPCVRTRVCQNGGRAPAWHEHVVLALENPGLSVLKVLAGAGYQCCVVLMKLGARGAVAQAVWSRLCLHINNPPPPSWAPCCVVVGGLSLPNAQLSNTAW